MRIAEAGSGKNIFNVIKSLCNILRPEKDPRKAYEAEGKPDPEQAGKAQLSHNAYIFAVAVHDQERHEINGIQRTPGNKGPVGPMPETAYQENNKGVPDPFPYASLASAQRNVQVISKPGGKGNVPPSPKLGNVSRKIRI